MMSCDNSLAGVAERNICWLAALTQPSSWLVFLKAKAGVGSYLA